MSTPDADARQLVNELADGAWAVGALIHLTDGGALTDDGLRPVTAHDRAAVAVLAAAGIGADELALLSADGMRASMVEALRSGLRQLATAVGIVESEGEGEGWAAHDDATLLAQGRASGMAGTMLATMLVPALEGLAERFAAGAGGVFLDVGVGVGEISAAFCEAAPGARAIGLDVLPRVLELAKAQLAARGLADRVELRHQAVQDLDDVAAVDLAWLPAPFIPEAVFAAGLAAIHRALRPGGWIIVGAGRLDDATPLGVAVTRWKTAIAGGTALPRQDAHDRLSAAGFVDVTDVPMPPGTPAIYAARRR